MKKLFVLCLLTTGSLFAQNKTTKSTNLETITLAGGCYWCVEAVYENLTGVQSAVSGYAGGKNVNPTYEDVSTGKSGYAEVVQITYDKNATNLDEIFKVFFIVHDPSTLNRQGADVGTQYRSAIFYKNEAQKKAAQTIINAMKKASIYDRPIVTTLELLTKFYKAEDYHQNYYANNKNQGYCQVIIAPKLQKVQEKYAKLLKEKL